jgi:haloacetate dehalogenase
MAFFDGFTLTHVAVPGGNIRVRHGGSGPPLLMLHGNPQSHCMWHRMWHRVAPALAERFTVICPDLRGYGESLKPPATPDDAPYAKREMAKDAVAVMQHFGFQRFRLAGHDRGGRVSHPLALDFPDRVELLAVLDIIPMIAKAARRGRRYGARCSCCGARRGASAHGTTRRRSGGSIVRQT